ncbi:MAG: ABC transporter permease subunit [Burkholderiaceae bacterium]
MSAGQQRGSLERPALLDRDPAQRERLTWLLIGLALLWPMLKYSEFSPGGLLDAQSMQSVGTFLASFLPPRLDAEFLWLLAEATLVTVAIATSGLALGWVLAVPLTLLATARLSQSSIGHPMRPLATFARQAVRALLIFLRSVPELVWALLFVRVVGLGPTAGVLAIALTYAGMLGKVYAEVLESGDGQATEALLRNGSGRMSAFLYGALPQNANELVSYTVFRWECAVRSSVIMGFVGGGGLGQQMDLSMKMLAGGEVSMILLMFVLLVALADRISLLLRRALDGHEATRPTAGSAGVISAEPPARLQATTGSLPPRPAQRAGWLVVLPLAVLVVLSFAVLDLRFEGFLEDDALSKMGEFIGGFFPPETDPGFLSQLWQGSLETLAMSALGTLIAAVIAVAIALPPACPLEACSDRWSVAPLAWP